MWEVEIIENKDCLFTRVHENFISSKDKLPKSTAFTNTPKDGDNLSSDWSKYCTAESSRELIGKQRKPNGSLKDFKSFFIWKMNVGRVRDDINPKQVVEHNPIFNRPEDYYVPNNRAHSIIIGEKPNNSEFRVALLKIGEWAIGPNY